MRIYVADLFSTLLTSPVSGDPIFSALPEKMGEKRGA